MKIFPAIDLKDGKVVRLLQGDYNKVTVYGENVLGTAEMFEKAGAEYVHVVDLDGARGGNPVAMNCVKSIVENTSLRVEIGGGIRDEKTVEQYLALGVWRVILGSAAIDSPEFCERMIRRYGEKIAVGVDVRDEKVCIHGWTQRSEVTIDEVLLWLQRVGLRSVICTDISKDGAMVGTAQGLYRRLCSDYSVEIIASGGISSLEDIRALKEIGVGGAVLGKALYTGAFSLRAAIEEAK